MIHASHTPPGLSAFRESVRVDAIGAITKISAARDAFVTHPDRDDLGSLVDNAAPAWTPNDLTAAAPDGGMVKVRWHDSADPTQLYWEYAAELRPADGDYRHQVR